MVRVVLLGEHGWAGLGVAGAQLGEVCRGGVFLVKSGWEQSRTWVFHSPGLGKRVVSQWHGEGKGWAAASSSSSSD